MALRFWALDSFLSIVRRRKKRARCQLNLHSCFVLGGTSASLPVLAHEETTETLAASGSHEGTGDVSEWKRFSVEVEAQVIDAEKTSTRCALSSHEKGTAAGSAHINLDSGQLAKRLFLSSQERDVAEAWSRFRSTTAEFSQLSLTRSRAGSSWVAASRSGLERSQQAPLEAIQPRPSTRETVASLRSSHDFSHIFTFRVDPCIIYNIV